MKLTIIAATGGVGRQLLGQALEAGHDVTAVVRNPARLPRVLADRPARIVAADLAAPDPQVLGSAVAGADAVLSALGPYNNSDAGIAAPGTRPRPSSPARKRFGAAAPVTMRIGTAEQNGGIARIMAGETDYPA